MSEKEPQNTLFFENIQFEMTILRTFRKGKHERKCVKVRIFSFFVDKDRGDYPLNYIGSTVEALSKNLGIPLFVAQTIHADRVVRRLAIEKEPLVRQYLERMLKPYKPKPMMLKKCSVCSSKFSTTHNKQKRCFECINEKRFFKVRECVYCGETYFPRTHRQKYCSNECFRKATYKPKKKRVRVKRTPTITEPIPRNCVVCSKPFMDHTRNHSKRFCSDSCRYKAKRKRRKERRKALSERKRSDYEPKPKPKPQLKLKNCAFCGKEFEGRKDKKYCSKLCKERMARKKNPEKFRAYHREYARKRRKQKKVDSQ